MTIILINHYAMKNLPYVSKVVVGLSEFCFLSGVNIQEGLTFWEGIERYLWSNILRNDLLNLLSFVETDIQSYYPIKN